MGIHELKFFSVIQEVEGTGLLGEVLFFPEFTTLAADPIELGLAISSNLRDVLRAMPPGSLHGRLGPTGAGRAILGEIDVTLDPPRARPAWQRPVELRLPVIRVFRGDVAVVYVPALGIEVIARKPESLVRLIPAEVRSALARSRGPISILESSSQVQERKDDRCRHHQDPLPMRTFPRGPIPCGRLRSVIERWTPAGSERSTDSVHEGGSPPSAGSAGR